MRLRTIVLLFAAAALAGAAGMAVFLSRDIWRTWLPSAAKKKEEDKHDDHGHAARVQVTAQARPSLRPAPIKLENYPRILRLPGVVIERQGKSDRSITTPIAGIVRQILVQPGETVDPAREMFVLRPNSESLQASQTELLKSVREKKVLEARYKRLTEGGGENVIPQAQVLELRGQIDRLQAVREAHRYDLETRGLTMTQIDSVEAGKFLDRVVVNSPASPPPTMSSPRREVTYEVKELKVQIGEQVQAGQILASLANHLDLLVEGHGFRGDAALLEKAAEEHQPVSVEVTGETGQAWRQLPQDYFIEYLAGSLEPSSQTFPFYVPLPNKYREFRRDDRNFRLWEFRPGQRVRVGVRVDEMKGVFVLPLDAVVREGAETYVFVQNGEYFDRQAVRVLFGDHARVVIDNDGSITDGSVVAHSGASTLLRAIKAKEEGGGGGHEGHSH